ncbi:MAG TPA: DoxX family protein [Flavobacteriaceae bacterium]|nr:DoxX family protein [Flavobacteriaceae bacterium]
MMLKNLFRTNPNSIQINVALLIARVAIGLMMLTHGWPKLQQLFGGEPIQFASVFGMSETLSLVMAVFAEVICSLLLILGLATRLAVIPLIVTMLIAVLHIHGADPFSVKETGTLFLLVFVILLIMGSGKYSVDAIISRR